MRGAEVARGVFEGILGASGDVSRAFADACSLLGHSRTSLGAARERLGASRSVLESSGHVWTRLGGLSEVLNRSWYRLMSSRERPGNAGRGALGDSGGGVGGGSGGQGLGPILGTVPGRFLGEEGPGSEAVLGMGHPDVVFFWLWPGLGCLGCVAFRGRLGGALGWMY